MTRGWYSLAQEAARLRVPQQRGLYVIGLTGNIATGKSTVAAMLEELGAKIIDADALAHDLMRSGTPVWQQVVDEFGSGILQRDSEVDRPRLGALVFANAQALERLEAIVHPAVIVESERLLEALRNEQPAPMDGTGPQIVVLGAIKLIESGIQRRCDELWVVVCPREQQVQRLQQTRGLSVVEAELRIDAQPPQADKAALADIIIDNGGDLEQTRTQVLKQWERIRQAQVQSTSMAKEGTPGGKMSSWRNWIEKHPFLAMWAILSVGMVAIFLITSRDVQLLLSQRLFMAVACVVVAGLCSWIVSWEP